MAELRFGLRYLALRFEHVCQQSRCVHEHGLKTERLTQLDLGVQKVGTRSQQRAEIEMRLVVRWIDLKRLTKGGFGFPEAIELPPCISDVEMHAGITRIDACCFPIAGERGVVMTAVLQ